MAWGWHGDGGGRYRERYRERYRGRDRGEDRETVWFPVSYSNLNITKHNLLIPKNCMLAEMAKVCVRTQYTNNRFLQHATVYSTTPWLIEIRIS
jgi:hypothetical protein